MNTISDICNNIKINTESRKKRNDNDASPLLRSFKFFDLKEEGYLSFNDFLKSLERIGIIPDSKNYSVFKELFSNYNINNNFNYTEFIIDLYPINIKNLDIKNLYFKY